MFFRILTLPFRFAYTKFRKAIGRLDTIRVEPLYAFGSEKRILFQARVVESYKQSKPSEKKTYLQNLLGTLRRYAGNSIPEAKVEVEYMGEVKTLESDAEGIINCFFMCNGKKADPDKFIKFRLLPEEHITPEEDEVLIPVTLFNSSHPRGVISDIDDTILISHATQTGRKLWLSVSKNAYTRRPFPGVSQFYKDLSRQGSDPVFYVSSSDWNLFDLIGDFLEFRHIPPGILLLKDLHINLKNIFKSGGGSHEHKIEKVEMIMDLYPDMKFVLIGDSGQHDPEIYAQVMNDFPGRVRAVYIREIKELKDQRRKLLAAKVKDPEAPDITFVKTTKQAMDHARNHSLI